ncbi:CheR family methyltransferase [Noviherbaspirillum pedocola]|uniref:Chemotaxis protein n=1 Tax=Noviherbaspirillum pedocola TaxID=2801341 RepID=A0A934W8R7_9BURK|nr:CheR family methyltransferase [Noviherbaspirillum pedocola]MBK4738972.1 chemotaxis protein [Noviherbaspirillum pedocola]
MKQMSTDERRSAELEALEALEIELLLEGLHRRYGLDFREYEREPLRRRLLAFLRDQGLNTPSDLLARVLHDASLCNALGRALIAQQGMLFDEPASFAALRELAGPLLGSYPAPKVWIAECLCPEEVFGLAILLEEEVHYERTLVFATCSNDELLQQVKAASIPAERIALYEERYRASGGRRSLGDYLSLRGDRAVFADHLRSRIIWAQYNLPTDSSFNEFQLICCRNRLADYQPRLQNRILGLFHQSLASYGVMNVGASGVVEAAMRRMAYRGLGYAGLYRRMG